MADFSALTKKIFKADKNIRGMTFGRSDGEILHFEMRPSLESLNPPGSVGKRDIEVLFPTLSEYFETHSQYFGRLLYTVVRFEKLSLIYLKYKNIFLIVSVQPRVATYPIVEKTLKVLEKNF